MYETDKLAKRIKKCAAQKHIQLKDLYSSCGLSKNVTTNLYKGSMLKADNLAKIADQLDVSVDYLLGRTERSEVNKE